MTVRSLNFTGRVRIPRKDVVVQGPFEGGAQRLISVAYTGGEKLDCVTVWLDILMPPYAASHRLDRSRFVAGDVQTAALPVWYNPERAKMHVRAVDSAGLVVAWASGVQPVARDPRADGERLSTEPTSADEGEGSAEQSVEADVTLLSAKSSDELGGEVWRVRFDADGVWVLVNDAVGDLRQLAESSLFRALVMPQVVRQVVRELFGHQDDGEMAEVPSTVFAAWRKFAETKGEEFGQSQPWTLEGQQRTDFIDQISSAVASEIDATAEVLRQLGRGGRSNG